MHFKPARLYKMIKSKAYLHKGVHLTWVCDQALTKDDIPTQEVFHFPNGLADYLQEHVASSPLVHPDICSGEAEFIDAIGKVEWAICWLEYGDTHFNSFCNTIPTPLEERT